MVSRLLLVAMVFASGASLGAPLESRVTVANAVPVVEGAHFTATDGGLALQIETRDANGFEDVVRVAATGAAAGEARRTEGAGTRATFLLPLPSAPAPPFEVVLRVEDRGGAAAEKAVALDVAEAPAVGVSTLVRVESPATGALSVLVLLGALALTRR